MDGGDREMKRVEPARFGETASRRSEKVTERSSLEVIQANWEGG